LSAVDTKTERIILKNLRGIRNKTTIVISHRLSAVRHADEILVFEEGRIIERGDHAGLIKSSGLYSRLWYMQSGLTEGAESIKPVVTEEVGSLQSGLTEGIGFIQPDVTEEGDA
jgi:energy-coupling factor transporter ATP-binding protein EcfA2